MRIKNLKFKLISASKKQKAPKQVLTMFRGLYVLESSLHLIDLLPETDQKSQINNVMDLHPAIRLHHHESGF